MLFRSAAAYAYGDGIIVLTDGMRVLSRGVLGVLPRLRRTPRAVAVVLVALLAFFWNHTTCTGDPAGVCVSPAEHWIADMELWIDSPEDQ